MTLYRKFTISLLLLTFTNIAQAQLIDKILVIINDEVVTQNELNKEFNEIKSDFAQRGKQLPDNPAIRKQVLEKLILKSILLQQAIRQNIVITERQIQASLKRLADRNNLNLEQFRKALQQQNIDYSKLRQKIKQELTIQQLQQKEARRLTSVSEQEVKAAIEQSQWGDNIEYNTAHILLPLPEAATPQQVSEQLDKINELLSQLNNGADFNTLAQQHSSGQQALEGGDLGWRKKHELPSLFVEPVSQLKKGEYSKAIRSPGGFHIIYLKDTRNADQVIISQTKARHILIKPDALQTEEEVIDKLNALRDRLLQGDDFAALARANSIDHVSASKGGELGWVSKGETVPAFEQAMDELDALQISKPFKSPFGWHILQVIERRNIDDTESVRTNTIKNQLLKRKKVEALELWQKRLRDQAYVKFI